MIVYNFTRFTQQKQTLLYCVHKNVCMPICDILFIDMGNDLLSRRLLPLLRRPLKQQSQQGKMAIF